MKSYEHDDKINLVNYSYFHEEMIPDKLQKAKEFGFLRGSTQDEYNWVVDKIRELRQARTLLYAHKPINPNPHTNGYTNNGHGYPPNNHTSYPPRSPPRSNSPYQNSPYGYNTRAPSPYERQPTPNPSS